MAFRSLDATPPTVASPSNLALAAAEDAVARLDERIASSPIAVAFRARTHFYDAAAAIFLEGDLIHLEDLNLHDAAADIHAPTQALTRAHAVLRARRRIEATDAGWAMSPRGLDHLRGQPRKDLSGPSRGRASPSDALPGDALCETDPIATEEDAFAAELAAMDTLIARTSRSLDARPTLGTDPFRDTPPAPAPDLPVERSFDDPLNHARSDRLADWRAHLCDLGAETPIMAAVRAGAALDALAPLPNQAWLGRLVIGDLLRARGKTRHHLLAINLGMKLVLREGWRGRSDRTAFWIAAITAAAGQGLRDHDRLLTARRGLERKLTGRRSTSKLPQLVDLVMRSPVVSSQTIAAELKITPRAAQNLVVILGLRELTGRTRYRCWGIV